MNPFGARAVRLYLREVRDAQAKARGIAYEKKKRRKNNQQQQQNASMMMVEDNNPVHDMSSSAVHYSSGYINGGFVQLSNSNGTAPTAAAVSYFSS